MDAAVATLDTVLGPLGAIYLTGGAGILLVAVAVPFLIRRRVDPMERVRAEREGRQREDGPQALSRHGASSEVIDRLSRYLAPADEEELSAVRLMLVRAGYPQREAVRTLYAVQFVLAVGLLAVGILYVLAFGSGLSAPMSAAAAIGPGLVGYYAPKYWLQKRVAARQSDIQDGFPDALDLLLVCVEAGQSLDQAILRMATEIEPSYPALASEFMNVSHEMKAGKDKGDVLRAMAERCDLRDISSFVTVLVQSQTFGTSIADALRVYAAEMRDKRLMRAEEKANTLPTKLTLGTMMFCIPPLLIILIGPSIYGISVSLSGGAGF